MGHVKLFLSEVEEELEGAATLCNQKGLADVPKLLPA